MPFRTTLMPSFLFVGTAVTRFVLFLMSFLVGVACVLLVGLLLIEPRLKRL
jgi:hypothetical protein